MASSKSYFSYVIYVWRPIRWCREQERVQCDEGVKMRGEKKEGEQHFESGTTKLNNKNGAGASWGLEFRGFCFGVSG